MSTAPVPLPIPMRLHPSTVNVIAVVAANVHKPSDWSLLSQSLASIRAQSIKPSMLFISCHVDPAFYPAGGVELFRQTILKDRVNLALDGDVRVLNQRRPKLQMHHYQDVAVRIRGKLNHDQALIDCSWIVFGPHQGFWHPLRLQTYVTAIAMSRPGGQFEDVDVSSVVALQNCVSTARLVPEEMTYEAIEEGCTNGLISCQTLINRAKVGSWMSEVHDIAMPLWLLEEYMLDAPRERQWLIENNALMDSSFAVWVRSYRPDVYKSLFPALGHWMIYWSRAKHDRTVTGTARVSATGALVSAIPLDGTERQLKEHAELISQMWELPNWQQVAVNVRKAQSSMLDEDTARKYLKFCAEEMIARKRERDAFIADGEEKK